MIDDTLFNFSEPNIFLTFFKTDHVVFVYSNIHGLNHLENIIKNDSLFFNLITPTEVLVKMSYEISFNYFTSSLFPWSEKTIHVPIEKDEAFLETYSPWKTQLEKFLGSENIYEVKVSVDEVDNIISLSNQKKNSSEKRKFLFDFIELKRLEQSLTYRNNTQIKPKI